MPLDTDPVVSAHGVEAVGTADEHQVVVPGNQHFDEVVALVLRTDDTEQLYERQPAFLFFPARGLSPSLRAGV